MVHVTHFNKLMWHNENCRIRVIEHGVIKPSVTYSGELEKGIVVINHLHQRGRKLGADIFNEVSRHIPLDLVGMGTKEYGGLGEVLHPQLPAFISRYRFFFNPIRYTSFGLAVCEAMMMGMPVVSLATTEYATVFKNEVSGFIHTDPDYLIEKMKEILNNKSLAISIGEEGKKISEKKFNIERFIKEWEETFQTAIKHKAIRYDKENSIY
jgi:glycosyltransferase involved in cell wall biosynthesis